MKAKTFYEYSYPENDDSWEDLGKLVVEFDESEAYEQNATKLFKKGTKYTLLASDGCSCWDGNWEGWTEVTKTELKKLGEAWSKDYSRAEKNIGEWIVENVE